MAKEKPKLGPYGEAIYPKAEEDLRLEGCVRYATRDAFADVARFYREVYGEVAGLLVHESEEKSGPALAIVPKKTAKEHQFNAIVVTPDPASKKKRKPLVHVIVTPRS